MITEKLLTPNILQTIIICCTIIIIATIGVSAYRVYQKQSRSWGSYIYYASILTLIGIIVFSNAFYGNRNVLDFVSLASALISIILAVVTILYSFYSNSQSAGQIETLKKAADSVEKATLSYSESAESLQENIRKIIDAVNRVEKKTDQIIGMKSSSRSNIRENDNFEYLNRDSQNFDLGTYIKTYINTVSPLGIMAMYACIKSKDYNKTWNLNLFTNDSNQNYCCGFMISINGTGFISLNINFNNKDIVVFNYLPKVKDFVTSWINNTDFSKIEGLQEIKNCIDQYFEENKEE
mgnify:FL=1